MPACVAVFLKMECLHVRGSYFKDVSIFRKHVQGDFDYSQLTFPTAEGLYTEEEKEDLSGVGDDLDVLLDVLPGKDAAAEAQAQDYADEIMLKDDSLVYEGGAQQGDAGQDVEELQFDDITEEDNIIDF